MDEVARVDPLGVEGSILKASGSGSGKVVFAGRSSEWEAETEHVKDYFGAKPVVVRLKTFNTSERRQLFTAHFPKENFDAFLAECTRFELHGRNAGDKHSVAFYESRYGYADLLNDPDTFITQYPSRAAGRHVTLKKL